MMGGSRDTNIFPLYGQEKIAGPLAAPFMPLNGVPLWVGALGYDNAQTGTAAGTAKNGTLASAAAGTTSLTYTVTNTTPAPVVGDIFQIGPAVGTFGSTAVTAAAAPGVYQNVKVTAVSGAGPYTLTVAALQYAVAANAVAQAVIAPFYHNVSTKNTTGAEGTLPSFTIEKNLGNYQSEQYAGCRVNKFDITLPATNSEASFTADLMGQSVAILSTPTAVTVDPAPPFVFAEGAVSLFGQTLTQATNVSFSIENTVKDSYTITNSHLAQFITPTTRKVTGKITMIFTSLNDATWGYFNQSLPSLGTPTVGALTLTCTHPGTNGAFYVNLPQCNFAKIGDQLKIGDVILQDFDFTGSYSLTSTYSISSWVANSQYTGF